ncbi:MAG: cell wall-binding repeat-containing protein [Bacillota bacterium]|nr:cell wall-binding repeat-containing protein [Bacillota bacterium]
MIKKRKSISLITSTVMTLSIFNISTFSSFIPVKAASDTVFTSDRISGADRFETADKIADKGWTTTSDYAVIATGEDYPDALCASPLAKKYNAPIILTETKILSDSAEKELKRLSVKNVFIVGGTAAVSSFVEDHIKSLGINTIRIDGFDRYDTSIAIAKYLDKNPKAIAIATGNNFADALSFSSIAAMNEEPILLIDYDSIDSDTYHYLNDASSTITTSYVIGGTGVVPDSVLSSLKNPIRLSGKNRYETNTVVLKYFQKDLNLSNVYLVTGNDFPDALASSVLASKLKTPVLLADSNADPSTISFVNDNTKSIKSITAIGGTNVISDDLLKNASENFVNFVIPFSEMELQFAIDEVLNKKDYGPILKKEIDKITTLNLSEKNIDDLQGIQYFTNLQSLNLYSNYISNLSHLSNLRNLKELNLENNYIFGDINALGNLKNLTKLNLSNDNYKITDLSALTNLKNLTELDLSVNKKTQNANCSYDIIIKNTDITPLSNLTNLTKLNLNSNNIKDITCLDNLKNLTELDLSDTTITDIAPLSKLTNLTKLDLSKNNITDLTPLSTLTNLIHLDLSSNSITDVTPLAALTNLTRLYLSNNPIDNTDTLKAALPNCVINYVY